MSLSRKICQHICIYVWKYILFSYYRKNVLMAVLLILWKYLQTGYQTNTCSMSGVTTPVTSRQMSVWCLWTVNRYLPTGRIALGCGLPIAFFEISLNVDTGIDKFIKLLALRVAVPLCFIWLIYVSGHYTDDILSIASSCS